jgi:soluble lytic murein transglycosylase-like protein
MHKLTVVTAALAAGVMNFAVSVAHGEPLNFRADPHPTPTVSRSQKSEPAGKAAAAGKSTRKVVAEKKSASAKARKTVARRKAKRSKVLIDTTTTASIPHATAAKPATASASGPYAATIARYAASYGVPVSLARAVIKIESNYRPHLTGSAGEVGLMQIKPATARMLGYTGSVKGLYDPETNIKYGMKYLAMAQGLGGGTTCGTILKYNAGHGAKRMNPVSSAYCSKVKIQMAAAATPA